MKKLNVRAFFLIMLFVLTSFSLTPSVRLVETSASHSNSVAGENEPDKPSTFLLKNASKNTDVKIEIEKCGDGLCEGLAVVYLFKKDQTEPFQTISLPAMRFNLEKDGNPDEKSVIFDDFNFDGQEDLALRNGNNGQYAAASFNILLFSKAKKQFVRNRMLTKLASEFGGLFLVDQTKKQIETRSVSGNAWSQTIRYQIVKDNPKKVYVFTVNGWGDNGKVILTTEKLVNGKWKKTRKSVDKNEFYKEY